MVTFDKRVILEFEWLEFRYRFFLISWNVPQRNEHPDVFNPPLIYCNNFVTFSSTRYAKFLNPKHLKGTKIHCSDPDKPLFFLHINQKRIEKKKLNW